MKLGAEPKKLGILGALVLVAVYFYISNSRDDAPPPSAHPAPRAAAPVPATVVSAPSPVRPARPSVREFKPSLKPAKPGEPALDPTLVDPTLRLDLLAKVQAVGMGGGERNLFQFGAAPLPKQPEPKIKVMPQAPALGPGQMQAQAAPQGPPPPPPPPPIPLKFYGYASKVRPNDKRAFFLDGDDIIVAGEGETIKQRYKVVRIGVNSAVVEDTQFRNQQTLALEEPAG